MAQKSPRKTQPQRKTVVKPKARCFRFCQSEDYLEIITTSFTNIEFCEGLTLSQALNNIAYSTLPNTLQPIDFHRQIILTLNPIVTNMMIVKICFLLWHANKINGMSRRICEAIKQIC